VAEHQPIDSDVFLGPAMSAFIQGPVSAFLSTVDAAGVADATRISGLLAVDRFHLRVLIAADATTALANATAGARVAVLVTDITDYRSVQWKAGLTRTPGDVALADHHVRRFADASPIVGLDPRHADRLFPEHVVPLVLALHESFDQTPGPRAGARIGVRS
jgi:hypothetical protein